MERSPQGISPLAKGMVDKAQRGGVQGSNSEILDLCLVASRSYHMVNSLGLSISSPPWLLEAHPAIYLLHQGPRARSVGALKIGVQPFFENEEENLIKPKTVHVRFKLQKDQPKTVHVRFKLQKECRFGQQILLVGDDPIFWFWDPSDAVPLHWSDGLVWNVELDIPSDTFPKYKFILK
ncbi:CBM20 domain-containing protein [Forsythia ovata]|uniref:CBM20 domain-containing protein n=1 Tax=Forsythia ovata TaxID=205694 RepID=A0ABD1TSS9_9LAMI